MRDYRKLTELIEPEKLFQLQYRISSTSDVVAVILDQQGYPVTPLADLREFCEKREATQGDSCMAQHKELFALASRSHHTELGICPHSGLATAALPICHGDDLVCVWIVCQFRYGEADITPTPLPEGRQDVPILNYSSLNLLLNFISLLTEDVLQIRQYNLRISMMEEAANQLAYTDRLLGIPNSLSLERDLRAPDPSRCLIILDIEDLRKINDVYGRECGDLLLTAMRDYIQNLSLPYSRLYRLEAADFAILLTGGDEEGLRDIARKLHDRCSKPWSLQIDGQGLDVFITVNVGMLRLDEEPFHDLSSAIEHTLDIARRGDGTALFDGRENKSFRNRLKLELSLRRSVRENMQGFYLNYQPIIDPGVALWRGVEALCRWENEDFGLVSPVEFIHIAETSGLINSIGLWVLEEAISQIMAWGLDQVENFVLHVNLSPIQLLDPSLADNILDILGSYNYPAHRLCLEITESNELNFSKHAMEILNKLSDIGVVLALDDFGTGYASLNVLHKMPVKIVKTDRSLINGVEHDSFLKRLFYVMVEMAHASDMKIVAEGVETHSQARLLLKEGADYFQGFQFSHPLSAKDMESRLDNFFNPSGELVSMGYSRIDLSRLSDEEGGYELPPYLYKLLSRCMRVLFSAPDGGAAIETALAYIGEELGVSRSYVFLKESDGTYSNTHEWCAPGTLPEKEHLQHSDIEGISPDWIKALTDDGMLVAADIRMLDPDTFGVLIQQGIKAVVEFPFWENGKLSGFVGFDDCNSIHYWTREEIQMLHILTSIISSTLGRTNLEGKLARQSQQMKSMLNHMDAIIYVTELDTGKILFVNNELEKYYGESVIGKTCWEVMQGKTERCDFCPVPYLMEHPGESYQWEFFNEVVGAHFRISDSIIPWDNDKLAHFEYALNITELKKYQMRLEEYASVDMLTGALNRSGFFAAAKQMLKAAYMEDRSATIAFIDIDGLKAENDAYGHSAGDNLIRTVVEALRGNIRNTDLIGRYGGDEFTVLFNNCTPANAERSLGAALAGLESAGRALGRGVSHSFSYGLVDTGEIPYSPLDDYLEQLLHLADIRMMENKKNHRKERGIPESGLGF